MKNFGSVANHLLSLLFLPAFALIAFGAEPSAPLRTQEEARISTLSDQKPSSLLVFNLYTSLIADPGKQDTSLTITNTNISQAAFVHLFLVGEGGSVADAYICLTPNQSATFLGSDIDPGVTGYAIAIATDRTGCPLSFNFLIGSEYIKLESGHAANFMAEGHAALYNGKLPGCSATSVLETLALDGIQYNAAARVLAVDKIPSGADSNSTLLIINSLSGNLAIGVNPTRNIEGTIFDDAENGLQFSSVAAPQFRKILTDTFPVTVPKFSTFIPAGRTGWMRVMAREDIAISGAVLNFNPDAATKKHRFNGGHNLHALRYTSGNLIVPVFEPTC